MKTKTLNNYHQKILSEVGIYLKELRYSENLTQEQVQSKTGLHRNSIYRAESKLNHGSNIKTILILCDLYQISIADLFSIID